MPTLGKKSVTVLDSALDTMMSALAIVDQWPSYTVFDSVYEFGAKLVKHEPWLYHLGPFDVFGIIGHEIKRLGIAAKPQTVVRASELLSKQDFDALRTAIRDYLSSLPREYEFCVELPSMPEWGEGEIKISERVSLVEDVPRIRNAMAELANRGVSPSADSITGVYLRVRATGFGAGRMTASAVVDAVSHMKQFFQLFRRVDAFKQNGPTSSQAFPGQKIMAVLLDHELPKERIAVELPEGLCSFLVGVTIDGEKLQHYEGLGIIGTARKAKTRDERAAALVTKIDWITKLMDCPAKWPDAERIRTSLEWAFDSELNENQTLAFIQACVGLEALLGDDDQEEPLTTRLADRCAYLLGKSHTDRTLIRKRFKNMYDVRSKLIHGRSPRLGPSDKEQLRIAQTMLGEVITEEARRLLRALSESDNG